MKVLLQLLITVAWLLLAFGQAFAYQETSFEKQEFVVNAHLLQSSFDGRFILYVNAAGTNMARIYVFDQKTQQHTPIGLDSSGNALLQYYQSGVMNDTGRYVLFSGVRIIGSQDIYLQDIATGEIFPIIVNSEETVGGGYPLDISSDGRYVLYSYSVRPPQEAGFGCYDKLFEYCGNIYLFDRKNDTREMISVTYDGSLPNDNSSRARMSDDAKYIVFQSLADNITEDSTKDNVGLFLREREAKVTTRIDAIGIATNFDISHDGHYVFYNHSGPFENDAPTFSVYRYDRITGEREQVSVSADGTPVTGELIGITRDGEKLLFRSSDMDMLRNYPYYYNIIQEGDGLYGISLLFIHDYSNQTTKAVIDPALSEDDGANIATSGIMSGNGELLISLANGELHVIPIGENTNP